MTLADFSETVLTERWVTNPWLADSPAFVHNTHLTFGANGHGREPPYGSRYLPSSVPSLENQNSNHPRHSEPPPLYTASHAYYNDDPAFSSDPRDHPDFIMTHNEEFVPAFHPSLSNPSVVRIHESPSAQAVNAPEEPAILQIGPPLPAITRQIEATTPQTSEYDAIQQIVSLGSSRRAILPPQSEQENMKSGSLASAAQRLRRVNSAPRMDRPGDLDKVDELDETDPSGVPWHHDGPYQAIPTPQAAAQQRLQSRFQGTASRRSETSQSVNSQDSGKHTPPSAVPYHINLEPGQILNKTILKPSRPINASLQPPSRAAVSLPGNIQRERNNRAIKSTESAPVISHSIRNDPPLQRSVSHPNTIGYPSKHSSDQLRSAESSPSQSMSLKNSSLRSKSPTRYHGPEMSLTSRSEERFRVSDIGPAAPDISLPPTSIRSVTREERPSPLHRPKHLIMPTPLQTAEPRFTSAGVTNSNTSNPMARTSTRANQFPIRDPKGRNLLRKRSVIGAEVIHRPESNIKSTHIEVEVEKESKYPRRLSKRRN